MTSKHRRERERRYKRALKDMARLGCQAPITEVGTANVDGGGTGRTYTCLEAMKVGSILQYSPRGHVTVERPCFACLSKAALTGIDISTEYLEDVPGT